MHASTALSLLALAGSSLAAPHYAQGRPQQNNNNVEVVYETVLHTKYVTEVYGQHPRPTHAPVKPKPSTVVQVKPSSAPVYVPAPKPTTSKVEPPAPEPTSETPPSNNNDYMAIVDEYRSKLGLKALKRNTNLEANALKTANDGKGEMKHWLGPGSMAQVLAPGAMKDFEHIFVGGWLCEMPNLPGLDGVCEEQSKGWMYTSDGHAKILTSPDYTEIGCAVSNDANYKPICACDLK